MRKRKKGEGERGEQAMEMADRAENEAAKVRITREEREDGGA